MAPPARHLFCVGLAALLCVACGRDEDTASQALVDQALEANARQQAGDQNASVGEQTLTLETEAGIYSATSGDNLPLPEGFPDDIALPADARIITATDLGDTATLGLHSPRSLDLVFDEFRAAQRTAGWIESTLQDQAAVRIAGFDKAARHLEAEFVSEPGGGTTLAISVGPAAD
jgi:hypothetical protein